MLHSVLSVSIEEAAALNASHTSMLVWIVRVMYLNVFVQLLHLLAWNWRRMNWSSSSFMKLTWIFMLVFTPLSVSTLPIEFRLNASFQRYVLTLLCMGNIALAADVIQSARDAWHSFTAAQSVAGLHFILGILTCLMSFFVAEK